MQLSHLQIRNPKDDETAPEAATQIFSSLLSKKHSVFVRLFKEVDCFAFEFFLTGQSIYYYVTVPTTRESLVQSLISASYPQSFIHKTRDPMDIILKNPYQAAGDLRLHHSYKLPLKTYTEFSDVDPLSSLIGLLSKQGPWYRLALQILVTPLSFYWQGDTLDSRLTEKTNPATGEVTSEKSSDNSSYLAKKVLFQGGRSAIRILAASKEKQHDPKTLLH